MGFAGENSFPLILAIDEKSTHGFIGIEKQFVAFRAAIDAQNSRSVQAQVRAVGDSIVGVLFDNERAGRIDRNISLAEGLVGGGKEQEGLILGRVGEKSTGEGVFGFKTESVSIDAIESEFAVPLDFVFKLPDGVVPVGRGSSPYLGVLHEFDWGQRWRFLSSEQDGNPDA